jgi:hypothetical protein
MNDEEIVAEMAKYTEALKKEKENADKLACETEDEDKMYDYYKQAKEKVHNIAMECLNKILTPELKVFVKNLCLDRLQYPDDPLFYEMFGDYPEVGDKISDDEIKKKNIDIWTIRDEWDHEGSCFIIDEEIDGKTYWVIKDLNESSDTESRDRRRRLRAMSGYKRFVIAKNNKSETETMFKFLNEMFPAGMMLEKIDT